MRLPDHVTLVEVGPRDGLQNESALIPTPVKVDLIERLADSGLRVIEAGAFVSSKAVPQMADTADVLASLRSRPGVRYPVLVPNQTGLERALKAGAREIAVFTAATDTFCRKNIGTTIAGSLERYAEVIIAATERGIRVRGYVSCALDCPYEGLVRPESVARIAGRLLALGCAEISLGDTIGTGTPARAQALVETVAEQVPRERLAAHFHDTYGQALANLLAVLERGVAIVDAAVAGLGGCPYAPGASGNVATEDVLYMLNGLGIQTGVDLDRLAAAGRFISDALNRPPHSKAARALAAREEC